GDRRLTGIRAWSAPERRNRTRHDEARGAAPRGLRQRLSCDTAGGRSAPRLLRLLGLRARRCPPLTPARALLRGPVGLAVATAARDSAALGGPGVGQTRCARRRPAQC